MSATRRPSYTNIPCYRNNPETGEVTGEIFFPQAMIDDAQDKYQDALFAVFGLRGARQHLVAQADVNHQEHHFVSEHPGGEEDSGIPLRYFGNLGFFDEPEALTALVDFVFHHAPDRIRDSIFKPNIHARLHALHPDDLDEVIGKFRSTQGVLSDIDAVAKLFDYSPSVRTLHDMNAAAIQAKANERDRVVREFNANSAVESSVYVPFSAVLPQGSYATASWGGGNWPRNRVLFDVPRGERSEADHVAHLRALVEGMRRDEAGSELSFSEISAGPFLVYDGVVRAARHVEFTADPRQWVRDNMDRVRKVASS